MDLFAKQSMISFFFKTKFFISRPNFLGKVRTITQLSVAKGELALEFHLSDCHMVYVQLSVAKGELALEFDLSDCHMVYVR